MQGLNTEEIGRKCEEWRSDQQTNATKEKQKRRRTKHPQEKQTKTQPGKTNRNKERDDAIQAEHVEGKSEKMKRREGKRTWKDTKKTEVRRKQYAPGMIRSLPQ
jgi:hypothetical protein